jgi:hypothetical protein
MEDYKNKLSFIRPVKTRLTKDKRSLLFFISEKVTVSVSVAYIQAILENKDNQTPKTEEAS